MRYPGTLQYLEAIQSANDLATILCDIKLVRDNHDEPIFSSGGFGTVYKVEINGKFKALKCFTREQPGRTTAYRTISKHFNPNSPHAVDFNYLEEELYVFYDKQSGNQFPVLIMDWVEGETLAHKIHRAAVSHQHNQLEQLSANFDKMALWLLSQEFAHGDIKPDNIIVHNNGNMVLVDYDGIYLPQMQGECQREVGTIGFQHPRREEMVFSKEIDQYSIAIISLSLRVLAQYPQFYAQYRCSGGIIFSPEKIMNNEDQCYNSMRSSTFAEHPLYKSLCSDSPTIEGLAKMISNGSLEPRIIVQPSVVTPPKLEVYKDAGKYGFTDQNGIPAVKAKYDAVSSFSENSVVVKSGDRWGAIDTNGRIRIQPIYDSVSDMSEGMAAVSMSGKYGYVNLNGECVVPLKYDNAWSFREGLALVKRGMKYGFVGKDGKIAIPTKFDFVSSFSEGYACARRDNLFGYIDKKGRWVVRPKYDFASRVSGGVATVEVGDTIKQLKFPPSKG